MKALILNSGIGHRMGDITKSHPKCMTTLLNHETIFGRQLRLLSEEGIKDFVITTGPFPEQLKEEAARFEKAGCHFEWIPNPLYDKTNYIYSVYCARQALANQYLLTLHGDLVFSRSLLKFVLKDSSPSSGLISRKIEKPEKDFKGRVVDGRLREVGINIFDEDCYAFQPLYKLSKKDAGIWLDSIIDFVENRKITNVYAENAFNVVSSKMNVFPLCYDGLFINEIDDPNDYSNVAKEIELIDYEEQPVIHGGDQLIDWAKAKNVSHPLFVVDRFLIDGKNPLVSKWIKELNGVVFDGFKPNPIYEDVISGINLFIHSKCDSLISVGGGSAIDTAKAIKLFLPLDHSKGPDQTHVYSPILHLAVPTTAGTGSESTRYAVVYYQGVKQSLTDDSILPDAAFLDTSFLKSLPLKQRTATVLDALCHGIESMWSINSTDESRGYAKKAISVVLANIDAYLSGSSDEKVLSSLLDAANLSGKAINIGQTTLAHAMSYKLTSDYHLLHGAAVAVCLPVVWRYLANHMDLYNDPRGKEFGLAQLSYLNELFGCDSSNGSISAFSSMIQRFGVRLTAPLNAAQAEHLASEVNTTRLKNFPISMNQESIIKLYMAIS